MDGTGSLRSPELWEVADQIGEFIEYWGFKRVHGRIWAHIYLSKTPLDALEIRKRLHISKALVSLTVRDLLKYSVVRECGKSSRGTILYEANSDLREAIYHVLRSRERKLMSRISASHKMLNQLSQADQEALALDSQRIKNLGQLIDGAVYALDSFLSQDELNGSSLQGLVEGMSPQ